MFQVVFRHWELIFFLLTSQKCNLAEVEKAMFQGLTWHFQLIFGPLNSQKCDLCELKKRLFYWLQGTAKSFSAP